MTRIDFHTNIADKVSYACRLARKAYAARGKLVLLASDPAEAELLDQALWSVGDTDFLPHVLASDALAPVTPIIVTASLDGEMPHYGMLLNLSRAIPPGFERFERVFEIVSQQADEVAAGRARYAAYKQQSYPLTHHVAEPS